MIKFLRNLLLPLLRIHTQRQLLYGNHQKALRIMERLYHWSGSDEDSFNLAFCLISLRQYGQALELIEPIYRKSPGELFIGSSYAQCLLLTRQWETAKNILQSLQPAHPTDLILKKMIEVVENPVERDKYVTSLDWQFEASLQRDREEYAAALELLLKAVELTPKDAQLQNNIGAVMLRLKYPAEKAMKHFQKAMEIEPNNDTYKRNYRKAWLKKGKQTRFF